MPRSCRSSIVFSCKSGGPPTLSRRTRRSTKPSRSTRWSDRPTSNQPSCGSTRSFFRLPSLSVSERAMFLVFTSRRSILSDGLPCLAAASNSATPTFAIPSMSPSAVVLTSGLRLPVVTPADTTRLPPYSVCAFFSDLVKPRPPVFGDKLSPFASPFSANTVASADEALDAHLIGLICCRLHVCRTELADLHLVLVLESLHSVCLSAVCLLVRHTVL